MRKKKKKGEIENIYGGEKSKVWEGGGALTLFERLMVGFFQGVGRKKTGLKRRESEVKTKGRREVGERGSD